MARPLLPRIASAEAPLHLQIQTPTPPQSPPRSPSTLSPPSPTASWAGLIHRWALRFSLHLALISLFETIFFWQFVSVSEDEALLGLVDSYTSGIFQSCAALTPQQRIAIVDVFDLFINSTIVDKQGAAAAAARTAFNHGLLKNSWAYFGGASTVFAVLAALARVQGRQIRWSHIVAENLCLVSVLGLYEWMFFHTVVFPYKSVSIPELDQHVVDQFQQNC